MNKEIIVRLQTAKEVLMFLATTPLHTDGVLAQRKLATALEAIDDAIAGKPRFPDRKFNKSVELACSI